MSEHVVDLNEVMERVQDDKELLLELFEIFANDYAQKTQILKSAVKDKNFEVIKDVIHSIKGAAGNISAKMVHGLCANIEQLCLKQDIVAVQAAIPVLDGYFKDLQVRVEQIKKEFEEKG